MSAREPALEVRHLGLMAYADALELQTELRAAREQDQVGDTILLLEHPDVITFGRSAKPATALLDDAQLANAGYEVYRVNRGGDVTWHGPGQLVGYPILDLGAQRDVHAYLRTLERVLIAALADFGIDAIRRDGYAGVWLDKRRKIASIGVGLRRWLRMHGFALNVCCDLRRFSAIIPCGLGGIEMTSMSEELGRRLELSDVAQRVEFQLRKAFA